MEEASPEERGKGAGSSSSSVSNNNNNEHDYLMKLSFDESDDETTARVKAELMRSDPSPPEDGEEVDYFNEEEEEEDDEEDEDEDEDEEDTATLAEENAALLKERQEMLSTFLALTHALDVMDGTDPEERRVNAELSAEIETHRSLIEQIKEISGSDYVVSPMVSPNLAASSASAAAMLPASLDDMYAASVHAFQSLAARGTELVDLPFPSSSSSSGGDSTSLTSSDASRIGGGPHAAHDPQTIKPSPKVLAELADEAQMKLLSFVAASQAKAGGKWMKAKYPLRLALPKAFDNLHVHYQMGRNYLGKIEESDGGDCLNMRFDMYFPGFPHVIVSEVAWRLFGSEEHARRITRSETLTLETLEEWCDPVSGDRTKVVRFENRLLPQDNQEASPAAQECAVVCSRCKRTLPRSTLTPPGKRARDRFESVDCIVASHASTRLYPLPARPNVVLLPGRMIQGSVAWRDGEGTRLVVCISFPNDYRYEGVDRLDANRNAFTASGNVTKWFVKLVEHATAQFVSYILEETLHRRGRLAALGSGGGPAAKPSAAAAARKGEEEQAASAPASPRAQDDLASPALNGTRDPAAEGIVFALVSPEASMFLRDMEGKPAAPAVPAAASASAAAAASAAARKRHAAPPSAGEPHPKRVPGRAVEALTDDDEDAPVAAKGINELMDDVLDLL